MPVSLTPKTWLSTDPATQSVERLVEIAPDYDAIIFDQWGVLHNGSAPYPGAIACLRGLKARGQLMTVLSNSGKRAAPNRARIEAMGFDAGLFGLVMTSGEALWRDVAAGKLAQRTLFAIERAEGDAEAWAEGLDVRFTSLDEAEAILLMGLPDGTALDHWACLLNEALPRKLPVFCSNPDLASPRSGGTVVSPGALAMAYADGGGRVVFYGKPYLPVFRAVEESLGKGRFLMVGDSLDHDIAGAAQAGWDSLLIEGGLYAETFAGRDRQQALAQLVTEKACPAPTYQMEELR